MSGSFTIGDFDVFDEWGNYAGKFTPSGGGIDGCLMIIALILTGVTIFVAYALIRVVIEGFRALFRGRFVEATLFLSPLWLTLVVVLFFGARTAAVSNSVHITKAVYVSSCSGVDIVSFTVENDWISPVQLWPDPAYDRNPCVTGDWDSTWWDYSGQGEGLVLQPGQKATIYSMDRVLDEAGVGVYPVGSRSPFFTFYP